MERCHCSFWSFMVASNWRSVLSLSSNAFMSVPICASFSSMLVRSRRIFALSLHKWTVKKSSHDLYNVRNAWLH